LWDASPYRNAARAWIAWLCLARQQALNWKLAGLGSTGIAALLALGIVISGSRASVIPYPVEVVRLREMRDKNVKVEAEKPTDAQIAFFLARLIRNIRSLSTDPVVVRKNWLEAYDYVTDRGALSLDHYARPDKLLENIGVRPISVEVIYVVRASNNSFEIRWKEHAYENGAIVNTQYITGVATLISQPLLTADLLRSNPIGLYVDSISWTQDQVNGQGN
jgi:type IV secretion system protein VirB5